jgi:hypothetical protein
MLSIGGGFMDALIDSVEVLVDPLPEAIEQSDVATGMGILCHYHPGSTQRLAEGFRRFAQTTVGRLVLARATDHLIVGYVGVPRGGWPRGVTLSLPQARDLRDP